MFVVSFGFAITLLGYVGSRVPLLTADWLSLLTLLLLGLAAASFVWAFGWFWQVVQPRTYRYLTPDDKLRDFAEELRNYYAELDPAPVDVEKELLSDVKAYVRNELAEAATQNQAHNHAKSRARSQVAFWLTAGFAFAFGATVLTFINDKLYATRANLERQNVSEAITALPAAGTESDAPQPTSPITTSSSVYKRGGRPSVQGGQEAMTKSRGDLEKPNAAPPTAKPTPPPPTLIKKSENDPYGKKSR
jgi:hypothetical protein